MASKKYTERPSKRNVKYWAERSRETEELIHQKSLGYIQNAKKQFDASEEHIERALKRLYKILAGNEGVSIEAARKLLKDDELEAFKMDVWEYVRLMERQEAEFDPDVEKELIRASVKARVSRLESVQTQMRAISNLAYAGIENFTRDAAAMSYRDAYYRSFFNIVKGVGVGASLSKIDDRQLETLLKRPWARDGSNFSERVWKNKVLLKEELPATLTQALIEGQSYTEAITRMRRRMGEEYYKCARIITTESNYFTTIGQRESFESLGVERYRIIAVLDRVTSQICRSMDYEVFRMDEFAVGETAPPFHPNCRTTISPFFDDTHLTGYIEGTRAARNPKTGKTIHIPRNMDYEEFEEKYVLKDD